MWYLETAWSKTPRGEKFRKNCIIQMFTLGISRKSRYVAWRSFEAGFKGKPRSFCSSCRYKWAGFWPVTRSNCKINSRCCVQFRNRQAWSDHFKYHNTKWSFHGKSKWGKQTFDRTLFWKNLLIGWPFQYFEITALEWE